MATAMWDELEMTDLVRQVLRTAPVDEAYGTGRPFFTTYQIAIVFARMFPQLVEQIGHDTGGEGHGPYAITNYLARWLPDRIARGARDIEMRFLSPAHLSRLEFDDRGTPRVATTNTAGFNATMFRLLDD